MHHPLIVTLKLNPNLAAILTEWRTRYFPPELNYLDAHVTLFHALPGEHAARWTTDLGELTQKTPSFEVSVPRAYSLGRGVALEVVAERTRSLRKTLRDRWLDQLSVQDQAAQIRPHVTVQNKVRPEVARLTLVEVNARWDSGTVGQAVGLSLYEYRGGPWAHRENFLFQN